MNKHYRPLPSMCMDCVNWNSKDKCESLPFWLMPVHINTIAMKYVQCTAFERAVSYIDADVITSMFHQTGESK